MNPIKTLHGSNPETQIADIIEAINGITFLQTKIAMLDINGRDYENSEAYQIARQMKNKWLAQLSAIIGDLDELAIAWDKIRG